MNRVYKAVQSQQIKTRIVSVYKIRHYLLCRKVHLVDLFPNASICENEACENVGTEDVPFCTKKGCPTTHPVLRMQQKDDMSPLYRLTVKVHYKQTGN